MYRIKGMITGVAPILFNRMTESDISNLKTGKAGGRVTDTQRIEESMQRLYRDPDTGSIYWPKWNFKKTILDGASAGKIMEGRKSGGPFIAATVFVEEDLGLFFGRSEPDAIHECVGKRPPRTGAACMIRRPMLNAGWELPFTLLVVDDRRPEENIKRAIEEAGLLIGMGSWRPEYGRFVLTEWSVEK